MQLVIDGWPQGTVSYLTASARPWWADVAPGRHTVVIRDQAGEHELLSVDAQVTAAGPTHVIITPEIVAFFTRPASARVVLPEPA